MLDYDKFIGFHLQNEKRLFNGDFSVIADYFEFVTDHSYSLHDLDGLTELLEAFKKYSKDGTDQVINTALDTNSIFHKGNLIINSDLTIDNLIVTGNLTINGKVKVNNALAVGGSLHFTQNLIVNTHLCAVGNELISSNNANLECGEPAGDLIVGGNIKMDGSLIYDYHCIIFGKNIQIKGDLILDGIVWADESSLEIGGNFVSNESFKAKKLQVEKSIISTNVLEITDGISSNESIYIDLIKTQGKIKYKKDIRIRSDYSYFENIEKI